MADNSPALRKRQQIENASKTMFIWVAVAAVVLAIAAVVSISLFQHISFKQQIINEKIKTVTTLQENNRVANELKRNIRILNTNDALIATPRLDNSEPLSVILDALPSNPNSSALGASLQQKLLTASGVTIDALVVDPISGVESTGEEVATTSTESAENTITFRFTVSVSDGQEVKLQNLLKNIEKSIRAINLKTVAIEQESSGGKITMSVEGEAFYQPASTVELKTKSCTPGKGC